jgi:hypothetical protein
MERREFIHRWGRNLLLGVITGATGYLAYSGKISRESSCEKVSNCKECRHLATCPTPKSPKGDLKSGAEFKPPLGGGGSEHDKILR